ncbi:MAG: HDOD domain-containing protein [Methylococcales bacterium]|nr:MAG: HDOD domain-containing protein [Methylococcales bacterium]
MKIDISQIKLPAMPMVAQKILSLNMNNDRDQDALVPVICQCPVTSARIISMASSVALSSGFAISSVKEAVQRIGLTTAYNSALASALFTLKSQAGNHEFDYNAIWKHSTEVRQVMQAFAKLMRSFERPLPQDIALVALLHDIGFLAYKAINAELADTLIVRINKGEDSDAVAQELFGFTHDKLGAALLSSWGIPAKIVTAVKWHHHKNFNVPHPEANGLSNLLLIADASLMHSAHSYDPHSVTLTLNNAASLLHINEEALELETNRLKEEGITISL